MWSVFSELPKQVFYSTLCVSFTYLARAKREFHFGFLVAIFMKLSTAKGFPLNVLVIN